MPTNTERGRELLLREKGRAGGQSAETLFEPLGNALAMRSARMSRAARARRARARSSRPPRGSDRFGVEPFELSNGENQSGSEIAVTAVLTWVRKRKLPVAADGCAHLRELFTKSLARAEAKASRREALSSREKTRRDRSNPHSPGNIASRIEAEPHRDRDGERDATADERLDRAVGRCDAGRRRGQAENEEGDAGVDDERLADSVADLDLRAGGACEVDSAIHDAAREPREDAQCERLFDRRTRAWPRRPRTPW